MKNMHRQIIENIISLLLQFRMPNSHWIYALKTSVFLINIFPSKYLNHISPYELLYGRKPDYAQLKVFACSCFPYLCAYSRNKLDN